MVVAREEAQVGLRQLSTILAMIVCFLQFSCMANADQRQPQLAALRVDLQALSANVSAGSYSAAQLKAIGDAEDKEMMGQWTTYVKQHTRTSKWYKNLGIVVLAVGAAQAIYSANVDNKGCQKTINIVAGVTGVGLGAWQGFFKSDDGDNASKVIGDARAADAIWTDKSNSIMLNQYAEISPVTHKQITPAEKEQKRANDMFEAYKCLHTAAVNMNQALNSQ